MALMLSVKEGESLSMDNGNIVVRVSKITANQVRLSIDAPQDVDIGRPYTSIKPPDKVKPLQPPRFTKSQKDML
jgi:carbon storage regulator CsrA